MILLTIMMGLCTLNVSAQYTLTVADSTATNSYVPIYGLYVDDYVCSQTIYPADMLTDMNGQHITALTFYLSSTPSSAWGVTFQVKLKEVTDAAFTSEAFLPTDATDVVYTGLMANNGNIISIDLNNAYNYNGGNLLLEVTSVNTGTYSSASFYGIQAANASVQGYDGDAVSDIDPSFRNFIPKTTFEYGAVMLCNKPYNLTVTDLTDNSATITWIGCVEASSYVLQYMPATSTDWDNDATELTTSDTSLLLSNLTGGTTYQVRVKVLCSDNTETAWSSVITFTPGIYVMAATGSDTLTTCGLMIYDDGGPNGSYSTNCNSTLVIYPANEGEMMMLSGTASMESGWDYLYIYDGVGTSNQLAQFSGENLTVNVISTVGPLTLKYTSDGSVVKTGFALLAQCVSCFPPTNLTASNPTMDGATISWSGNADEYAIYLSGAMTGYYTTNDTTYTFVGLNPSSLYTVQVRALCSSDSSVLSNALTFSTSCDAIAITEETPWFEDFESYTGNDFVCWTTPVTYTASNGVFPMVYCGYGQSCHSGVNSVEFKGTTNVLVLPEFSNNISDLRLSFWATATTVTSGTVEVGYVTDALDATTFVSLANAGTPGPRGDANAGNGNYMGPFDFNGVTESSARIALRYNNASSPTASWNLDDFTVSLAPSCPSPVKTSVQASNIDGHSATITWVDNDDTHSAWTVYYREVTPTNDGSWESLAATDTFASITGLDPETPYEVYVITNCGTQETNPDATLTITFTTTVACPVPTALTLASVSNDEAVITWVSTADNFNVEYGPAGFTPGSGTTTTVSDNTITLDNLTPATSYTMIVIADCGSNDGVSTAASIDFTTTQVPVDLPYTADFTDPADAWVLNNGSCSNVWMIGTANNVPALFITNDNSTPGYNISSASVVSAEKLFTVGDNASLNISFDVNIGGESSWDYLKVFFAPATESYPAATSSTTYSTYDYSTNAVDFQNYLSQTGYTSYPYKLNLTQNNTLQVAVEMPNPNENPDANSTAKLVFLWKNDSSSGTQPGAIVSNVTVSVNSCPAPSGVADSNITTSTADIYWTPGDEETEWVVEYGLHGFAHGTGTVENVFSDPSITLTNLNVATTYDVYVKAICGSSDSSLWVGPLSFVTNCDVITVLPYTENFDGYSASSSTRPNCWSFPITYSNAPYITSSYSSSAPNSLYFQSLTTTPTTAVSPQFAADINTLRVKFMLKAESTTSSGTFEVGVMSDPNDVTTFESVQIIQPANTNWNQYTIDLDSVTMTGGNNYIAFRQNSNSSSWYYWLDDVMVMEIPACLEPTGLAASNNTTTSVDLTWISNDNDFNVYYKRPNDTDWSVEQNVSLNNGVYTLSNLTPSSTYFWKVANNCSDGTESMSMQSSFSTLMETEDIPYSTDFAEGSDQAWLLNNGTCPNYWTIGTVDSASALYITNNGTTPGYNVSSISVVSAEKLFTIGDAPEFIISFDAQIGGESMYDYLKVFLAPASSEFPAATTAPDFASYSYSTNAVDFSDYLSQTGYTSYPYKLNLTNGNTLHVEVTMPNPNDAPDATSTAKLVFVWKNDLSAGTQPGAIIYNISFSTLACPKPTNLTVTNVGQTSADLSWTPGDAETAWNVEYKESSASTWNVIPVTTPSYQLTNLSTITSYDVRVQADCGDETSLYTTASFSTEACDAADQCTFTFNLTDSYGDGWNGGSLDVQQNGVTVATLQMTSGSTATETVQLCDNVSTSLVWNSGSYDDEAGFSISGPDGTVLFSQDDMETYSTYTFTTDCSGSGPGPVITDPTVATTAATAIAQTTATLNATITNPDNVSITAKGFEWKATTGGTYTQIAGTGTGNTFTANLSGLTANTGYTYKAFITYNGTTVYGNEMTFTTLPEDVEPCDAPTGLTAGEITGESIAITWDANDNAEGYNIQYSPQGGSISSAFSATNSYTISGLTPNTTYQIQVQANCGDGNLSGWSESITVATTGIDNYLSNSIALYPNPANDVVNVQCTMNNVQLKGIEVIDVYGKVVRTVVGANNYSPLQTQINVSDLATGMYFVRVTTEEGVVTKQFVKR